MITPGAPVLDTPPRLVRNRGGRPTAYSAELVTRILAAVREEGLSPTAATEKSGISRGTLSRWRRAHPNFEMRLQYARSEYRRVRLGRVRPRFHQDGRPNWRTAARELELAFPEEYSMNPAHRAAFRAQRDYEQREWERARAEFARETSGTVAAPPKSFETSTPGLPCLGKFQNSPTAPLVPPSPSPEPEQKFQNPTVNSPQTPNRPPGLAPEKLQNPPAGDARPQPVKSDSTSDLFAAYNQSSAPTSAKHPQKFQNPAPDTPLTSFTALDPAAVNTPAPESLCLEVQGCKASRTSTLQLPVNWTHPC